ncbi:hypothetical protein FRC10_006032 [Ceratobasidium sp. 414]|nr:hypothetical protein FRC10_006032 [Ceratobasidium sp. 414]
MGFYDHNPGAYAREYSAGYRIGPGLVGITGLCSAFSTSLLLLYITRHTFFNGGGSPMARGVRAFSHSALGTYLYSLLLSDVLQGVGYSIGLKWASDGGIRHSVACTVQGALGYLRSSLTLINAPLGNRWDIRGGRPRWCTMVDCHSVPYIQPSVWTTRIILGAGWTAILVAPIVGPLVIQNVDKSGHFYAVLGPWCWIGPGYELEWFLCLYMWVFLALVSSTVMYGVSESSLNMPEFLLTLICSSTGLLYLRLSGRLSPENGKLVWKTSGQSRGLNCLTSSWAEDSTTPSRGSEPGSSGGRAPDTTSINGTVVFLILALTGVGNAYTAYSIVTLPVVILRLGIRAGWKPPFPYIIFAGAAYSCSGLANVLLFIVTRHSFIQQAAAVRPRVHVSTQQVTIMEDARGTQTIHLHELSSVTRPEEQDGSSEKIDLEEHGSFKLKGRMPDAEEDVGMPTVGVRFLTKERQ